MCFSKGGILWRFVIKICLIKRSTEVIRTQWQNFLQDPRSGHVTYIWSLCNIQVASKYIRIMYIRVCVNEISLKYCNILIWLNPDYTDVVTAIWPVCNQKKISHQSLAEVSARSRRSCSKVAERSQTSISLRPSFGLSQKTCCDIPKRHAETGLVRCRSIILRPCCDQSAIDRPPNGALSATSRGLINDRAIENHFQTGDR